MFSIFKQFPNFLKERQFCSPRKIHGHSDKLMAQGADPQRSMKIQGGGVSSMSLYQCVSLYKLITTYTDIWTSHVYPTFVSFLILFLSTTCTVVSGLQPVGLPLNRFGRWSFQSRLVNIAPNGSFTVSHVFPSLWPLAARSHCFLVVLQARRYPPAKSYPACSSVCHRMSLTATWTKQRSHSVSQSVLQSVSQVTKVSFPRRFR